MEGISSAQAAEPGSHPQPWSIPRDGDSTGSLSNPVTLPGRFPYIHVGSVDFHCWFRRDLLIQSNSKLEGAARGSKLL